MKKVVYSLMLIIYAAFIAAFGLTIFDLLCFKKLMFIPLFIYVGCLAFSCFGFCYLLDKLEVFILED